MYFLFFISKLLSNCLYVCFRGLSIHFKILSVSEKERSKQKYLHFYKNKALLIPIKCVKIVTMKEAR